jgi:hypothetical protein
MMLATLPPLPRPPSGVPGSSRFSVRPQLMTRLAPLPEGRDISRVTLTPEPLC